MNNTKTASRIAGLGIALPEKIMTNHDLEKIVETSDDWITTRTGIKERRIADKNESASSLAMPAVTEALENANISPSDLDLIICATSTPDRAFPSTACTIQQQLGAGNCAAFDISAACSGFLYALTLGDSMIRSGQAKNVLLVTSELFSRIVDWTDRATCVLFGDGASAVVLTGSDGKSGIVDSKIHADGRYADDLVAGSGSATGDVPEQRYVTMKGNQTFKVAVNTMSSVARKILDNNDIAIEDIDLIVPHQANIRILNAVAKNLGLDEKKLFINMHKYGNTSATSIPLAMYEALAEGRLKRGDKLLLVAFGGGFTWGASLINF